MTATFIDGDRVDDSYIPTRSDSTIRVLEN